MKRWGCALVMAAACGREPRSSDAERSEPLVASRPALPKEEPCTDWSKQSFDDLAPLPQSPWRATLETVWRRVAEKHYDPTLGCVDWPAERLACGTKLAAITDEKAAFEQLNAMLDALKQSHFRVMPPNGDAAASVGPWVAPLAVRWIEEKLVVVESDVPKIRPGSVITKIADQPVTALVDETRRHGSSGSKFAFSIRRAAMATMGCKGAKVPGRVHVRLEARSIERRYRCRILTDERVTLGNLTQIPMRVESRMIRGTKVGYLAFNVWMFPVIDKIEAALLELRRQGMAALVLDLRGNPGGVGAMSVPIARMLLPGGGSLGTLQFRAFAQEFVVEPARDPFAGPIALLVDEGTASTSEIFAAGMRDLGRVRVVGGRPSAGAALPSIIEKLEGGALLQYVVGDYHSSRGTVVEGRGIVPDVVVPETRADFANGRDPVLDRAVEMVQNPR